MRMGLIMHEVSNQLTHDPTGDEQRVAARVDAIVRDATTRGKMRPRLHHLTQVTYLFGAELAIYSCDS